jgi:outer membrane protein assembly factor BamB
MSTSDNSRSAHAPRVIGLLAGTAVIAAIAVAPLETLTASAATPSSPWSQTNGSAGQGRANLTEKTLTTANVSKIKLLRSLVSPSATALSQYCDTGPASSPVLSGGSVYDVGNQQISKYNAKNGHRIWHVNLTGSGDDPELLEDVAVTGGLVLVAEDDCTSRSDPDGTVEAYNATTGTHKWTINPGAPVQSMVVAASYVVVVGDTAGDGEVVGSYRIATGAQAWQLQDYDECGDANAIVVHSLVIREECDYTSSYYGIEADSLATGADVWNRDLIPFQSGRGTDDIGNGRLYTTLPNGSIDDLNAATGATRFALSGATNILAIDNTRVYADCGPSRVCGIDQGTGKQIWGIADSSTLAAEANGVLYLGDGQVVNAATGKILRRLWKLTATSLAVGDGRIAVVKPPVGNLDAATMQLYGLAGE